MSDSKDNQEFLALQREGESDTKTAEHTEVSDPNTESVKEDTEFIENNQKSGDGNDGGEEQQQSSSGGSSDDSSQQQSSSSGGGDSGDSGDSGEQKEGGAEGGEKKKKSGTQENVESIPTAGGERLGEKHWGESKIVPDIPKKEGEENVSSSDGQPDQETKDNTAKNAGGSSGTEPQEEKSLIDKIKDKLPIGGAKE